MKSMKTIFLSGLALVSAILTLSFTIKDNSLKSLKANAYDAPGVCTRSASNDCISGATGNVYTGYRAL